MRCQARSGGSYFLQLHKTNDPLNVCNHWRPVIRARKQKAGVWRRRWIHDGSGIPVRALFSGLHFFLVVGECWKL